MAFLRCDFMSQSLMMNTSVLIVVPDNVKNNEADVIYLLHGLSDNATCWSRYSSVERYAFERGCALVMPEVQRGFYTDMEFGVKYFTYITQELPEKMQSMFNFSSDREHNFIAGLSMGGYGAMKAALSCPEKYAGCAAFSSAFDMQKNLENKQDLFLQNEMKGIFGLDLKLSDKDDLYKLLDKAKDSKVKPRMFVTCGTEDGFIESNREFAKLLENNGFEVSYHDWEDGHTWRFWDASIQLAMDFFFDKEV